jgi:crotonobetainyl-CoA:carnitine CoA-transferase CaiB-like acyl-CoA transferase
MLSQLNYLASAYLNAEEVPKRYPNGAHPYIVPAQIFETADGHVALFVSHDEFWVRLARELGEPHWLSDERFATMQGRAANRDLVLGEIAAVLRRGATSSWVERLAPLGVVIAGVETLDQALHSAHVAARGMVITVPVGEEELKLVASPIKIDGWTPPYTPPPLLQKRIPEAGGSGPLAAAASV